MVDIWTYVQKTIELMKELRIPIRDTYSAEVNLDDFYTNGNRYNGARLMKIEWSETSDFPGMKANKIYNVPPHRSAAYDAYKIVMPIRYKALERDDAIVHELVHFLQHNTTEEDGRYVAFSGSNYLSYIGQRVEVEAHAVQIIYIMRDNPTHRDRYLSATEQERVLEALTNVTGGVNYARMLTGVLIAKEKGLV